LSIFEKTVRLENQIDILLKDKAALIKEKEQLSEQSFALEAKCNELQSQLDSMKQTQKEIHSSPNKKEERLSPRATVSVSEVNVSEKDE
jgi:hypothetical protein